MPSGGGLRRLEHHAEDLPGRGLRARRVVGQLHPARLAAPARVDLGLDHHRAAEPLGDRRAPGPGCRPRRPPGTGTPNSLEDRLALVLVDLHRAVTSCRRDRACAAPTPPGRTPSATRSLSGMMPLSVMWMCSGQTSVQHLVMLQRPMPELSLQELACGRRCRAGACRARRAVMKKRGPGEALLLLLVVADDVADVLAQEALDALAELLDAVDVLLHHPVRAVRVRRLGLKGGICLAFS